MYVASKESITAWTGFDGATFATHRTVVAFKAGVGEVNGIAPGPDGRLVVGISAPCDACVTTDPDSAAVVSFLPDGSDLRVVASGIRAPVGLAFRPDTGDLLVTLNQRDDHAVIDSFEATYMLSPTQTRPRTVWSPPATLTGTTAIVAEWANGMVLQVALSGSGSATTGTVTPFLVGLASPVAVLADGAGGVLVGDWATGTIVRIGAGD